MDSPGFEFQLNHLSLTCHCLRDEIFKNDIYLILIIYFIYFIFDNVCVCVCVCC